MKDCIFCKIAKGKIPANKIYEDEDFIVFLDIRPINKGHCLIVPKQHYERLDDMPDEVLARELPLAKRIAKAVLEVTGMKDYNLFNTNGETSGQEVFHHHLHVIPRKVNDGLKLELTPVSYEEGEAAKLAEAISKKL